jgi:hypothetical protein
MSFNSITKDLNSIKEKRTSINSNQSSTKLSIKENEKQSKNLKDDFAYRKLRKDNRIKPSSTNLSSNGSIDYQSNLLPSQIKAREKAKKDEKNKNKIQSCDQENILHKAPEDQKLCENLKTHEKTEINHKIVSRRYPKETNEYYNFSKSSQQASSNHLNINTEPQSAEDILIINQVSSKSDLDKCTNKTKDTIASAQQRSNSLPSQNSISFIKPLKKLSSNPSLTIDKNVDMVSLKNDLRLKKKSKHKKLRQDTIQKLAATKGETEEKLEAKQSEVDVTNEMLKRLVTNIENNSITSEE